MHVLAYGYFMHVAALCRNVIIEKGKINIDNKINFNTNLVASYLGNCNTIGKQKHELSAWMFEDFMSIIIRMLEGILSVSIICGLPQYSWPHFNSLCIGGIANIISVVYYNLLLIILTVDIVHLFLYERWAHFVPTFIKVSAIISDGMPALRSLIALQVHTSTFSSNIFASVQ